MINDSSDTIILMNACCKLGNIFIVAETSLTLEMQKKEKRKKNLAVFKLRKSRNWTLLSNSDTFRDE